MYRDFKHIFYKIFRDIKNGDNTTDIVNDTIYDNEEEEILDLENKTLIWVVGGPGSKKYERVTQAMAEFKNWKIISTGK